MDQLFAHTGSFAARGHGRIIMELFLSLLALCVVHYTYFACMSASLQPYREVDASTAGDSAKERAREREEEGRTRR